jgi:hypothetical protein
MITYILIQKSDNVIVIDIIKGILNTYLPVHIIPNNNSLSVHIIYIAAINYNLGL